MASLKKLMVLKVQFLMLLALIAMANARLDFLELPNTKIMAYVPQQLAEKQEKCPWPSCCQNCVCEKDESGKAQCECLDLKYDGVPPGCINGVCLLIYPGYCRCLDKTETCPPKCLWGTTALN